LSRTGFRWKGSNRDVEHTRPLLEGLSAGLAARDASSGALNRRLYDTLQKRSARPFISQWVTRVALQTVEREIANFTRAIVMGGDLESLVGELHAREARRRELLTVIGASESARRYDPKAIEQRVRERLDGWQRLLGTTRVADGRQFLREALDGPLLFTPDGEQYRFEGNLGHNRVISGIVDDDVPVQLLWRARQDSNLRPPA